MIWTCNSSSFTIWACDQPCLPIRFYLEVGLLERGVIRDAAPGHIVANRHLRTLLQAKGL